jgi:ParB-like chromosome segregation protein Spo0J
MTTNSDPTNDIVALISGIADLPVDIKVAALNRIREALFEVSPFNENPVDNVRWVAMSAVNANDYNPNAVAPPEMQLLERSIDADGFTQPIVVWEVEPEQYEVVDGFHRNRVGKECATIKERVHGYLPVAVVNEQRIDRGDRIAATIRHNRARGKHLIDGMAEIVLELKRRNWSDKKIAKDLGMDPDEILRLSQIQGLAEMFADKEFSAAWEADTDTIDETDTLVDAG